MRRIVVREYEALPPLPALVLQRLEALDSAAIGHDRETVLDWRWRRAPRAKSSCGVLRLPDLEVEILPKLTVDIADESQTALARRNFLYMLSLSGHLPFREKDLAEVADHDLPLSEALASAFANRLFRELSRGVERAYETVDRTESFVRGRIRFSEQIRRNFGQDHLVHIRYERYQSDTQLNRILLATVKRLQSLCRSQRALAMLSRCELQFDGVSGVRLTKPAIDAVQLTRNSQRFAPLIGFARIVEAQRGVGMSGRNTETFSLLFPMEQVFERFVAALFRMELSAIGHKGAVIRTQARGDRRALLEDSGGRAHLWLKPDIVISSARGDVVAVIDTKWKQLSGGAGFGRQGVSPDDIFQLSAYARRYESSRNVLLYPRAPGVRPATYELAGSPSGQSISVRFLTLGAEIRTNRLALRQELRAALNLGEAQFH